MNKNLLRRLLLIQTGFVWATVHDETLTKEAKDIAIANFSITFSLHLNQILIDEKTNEDGNLFG